MASLLDTIGKTISNAGGRLLTTVSKASPTAGGKLAKTVDTVGKALGNPFPETYATEKVESAGGNAQRVAIEQNKNLTPQQKQLQLTALNTKTQERTGKQPASGSTAQAGQKMSANQVASLAGLKSADEAWNGKEVTVGGNKFVIRDNGDGTRTLQPISSGGGGGGGGGEVLGEDDFRDALSGKEDFIGQEDLNTLMEKYGGKSRDNARALADEIERVATENADREYRAIKDALGVQKGEVNTVAGQQRNRVEQEKGIGLAELTDKEETETTNIEKQKAAFMEEKEATADQLAQNWRDLSREVQRIMRARGITDSSFSAGKETDVLLDFNKGLRTLAKQSTSAIQDFGEAVVETNKFYTREKNKLEIGASNQLEDIDTWVRQQVQSIQAQENKALAQKLNEIRSAIGQGNQLKIQVEQSIADKQFALDSWVVQTQIQYKQAVALAAQNKVGQATTSIKEYRDQAKQAYDLVTKGGYEFQTIADANGNEQTVLHGTLPNGEDDYMYLTPGGAATLQTAQANYLAGKPSDTEQLIGSSAQAPVQQKTGILSTIGNLFR